MHPTGLSPSPIQRHSAERPFLPPRSPCRELALARQLLSTDLLSRANGFSLSSGKTFGWRKNLLAVRICITISPTTTAPVRLREERETQGFVFKKVFKKHTQEDGLGRFGASQKEFTKYVLLCNMVFEDCERFTE